jgi:putative N-acetylmannosamine-6-phosphate epimerase
MTAKWTREDGWKPFLLVAAGGAIGIYIASTMDISTMPKTATMAIIGIIVVVAYEHYIGWG